MLNYVEKRPDGYWVTYDEPDNKARLWLSAQQRLESRSANCTGQACIEGSFETNEKEAWVPAWYTRGADRCRRDADWFFEIRNLEPWGNEDDLAMEHYLRQGFEKWGTVAGQTTANKLIIYKRTGNQQELPTQTSTEGLPGLSSRGLRNSLRSPTATPDLPLHLPVASIRRLPIRCRSTSATRSGWKATTSTTQQPLRPGDTIRLTLYWRAQQPIFENYKVFNQSFYAPTVP